MQKKLESITEEALLKRIENEAPATAPWVFDCDGTLIHGDIASMTAWALIRFQMAHSELLPPEYDEFRDLPFDYTHFRQLREKIIARMGINAIYEWEAFLHAGLPPKSSLDMAKFAITEGLKEGHIRFTTPLADLARRQAARTWICSGSPDVCVWAVAEHLGIPHDRVIGTKLEMVDGVYANRIMEPGIIWEGLKRVALERQGVRAPYFVAGDTIGDWAMFDISARWCWCIVWGKYRHRGEEFRDNIQQQVLGVGGPVLPEEPGYYLFNDRDGKRTWVFEILGARVVEPTSKG